MFTSEREKGRDPHILAPVELDMQKLRMHIVLSDEPIRGRLEELEYPFSDHLRNSGRVAPVED